jgi:hypothetical protein
VAVAVQIMYVSIAVQIMYVSIAVPIHIACIYSGTHIACIYIAVYSPIDSHLKCTWAAPREAGVVMNGMLTPRTLRVERTSSTDVTCRGRIED